jgi:hypothetical protein
MQVRRLSKWVLYARFHSEVWPINGNLPTWSEPRNSILMRVHIRANKSLGVKHAVLPTKVCGLGGSANSGCLPNGMDWDPQLSKPSSLALLYLAALLRSMSIWRWRKTKELWLRCNFSNGEILQSIPTVVPSQPELVNQCRQRAYSN